MRVYRIGDPDGIHPIYSGDGAARYEGRWHDKGQDVIYTSRSYSLAMLEKLANFNGVLPRHQHWIEITIPALAPYEVVTADSLSNWLHTGTSRALGSQWFRECRSLILIVPSVVARIEQNVLINPHHKLEPKIRRGLELPVVWDDRLFERKIIK